MSDFFDSCTKDEVIAQWQDTQVKITELEGELAEAEGRAETVEARVTALKEIGEQVAVVLESTCKDLGGKNPRKTIPVLAAWDALIKEKA